MGCHHSKISNLENKKLELNSIPEPEEPPPTDPRLPLDARQVFRLKKSWKGIKRNMEATGVETFIRMFRANAELKEMFKDFRNLESDEDMYASELLENHAKLVMGVVDESIQNIDNVDLVIEVLHRAGKTHGRISQFYADVFWNIEQPFLDSVKFVLGDRFTEQMEVIYKIAVRFVLENIIKGFKMESV